MVLSPRIVGKVLHLHPVLVLAVLVIGEHLFGIWGLLLGVPLAVYAIHVGILADGIPGIYEPPGASEA
jgi:predicted PurR-regulated permease PerM